MKKLLLPFLAAVALAAAPAGARSIYLMGDHTDWAFPSVENSAIYEKYALEEGADGVYRGTFNFADLLRDRLYFRFATELVEGTDNWDDTKAFSPFTDGTEATFAGGVYLSNGTPDINAAWFLTSPGRTFTFEVNLADRILKVTTDYVEPVLYFVGTFTGWTTPSQENEKFYQDYRLRRVGPRAFLGTFPLDPVVPTCMRFYSDLTGWDGDSWGCKQEDELTLTVLTDGKYSGTLVRGKGAYEIEAIPGTETLQAYVDMATMQVEFRSADFLQLDTYVEPTPEEAFPGVKPYDGTQTASTDLGYLGFEDKQPVTDISLGDTKKADTSSNLTIDEGAFWNEADRAIEIPANVEFTVNAREGYLIESATFNFTEGQGFDSDVNVLVPEPSGRAEADWSIESTDVQTVWNANNTLTPSVSFAAPSTVKITGVTLKVRDPKFTGIHSVTLTPGANAPAVEYFNLQGIRVNAPAPGSIVIERRGADARKILVK